jgi:hypothetical protein
MTISQLLSQVLSKRFFMLLITLLLSACNSGGGAYNGNTVAGVTQETTPQEVTPTPQEVTPTPQGVTPTPQGVTQDVVLSWTAPVEREDGTPISMSEIAGYRVYYGTSEGNYPNKLDIADSYNMQATLSNLASGTYYIVLTSYDMDGRESSFSEVVTKSV